MTPININELTLNDLIEMLQPMFDEQLGIVRKNIADKRAWATAPRTVTIEISIKPDENREMASLYTKVKARTIAITSEPQKVDLTKQQYIHGLYNVK